MISLHPTIDRYTTTTKIQKYKNTKIQKYKNNTVHKIQKYHNAKIQISRYSKSKTTLPRYQRPQQKRLPEIHRSRVAYRIASCQHRSHFGSRCSGILIEFSPWGFSPGRGSMVPLPPPGGGGPRVLRSRRAVRCPAALNLITILCICGFVPSLRVCLNTSGG